ncbi:unnamed protein product [Brassica napus]|uniref:(rape) hypothetical protein n=1 Tax=Brassica napus TaxID=3708 RepID=A0A816Q7M1_BRANA|nr:unnamed protein product [Brassica napus]
MLPTLSWIQQIRQRSKWPPDHQDIVNFAKHIGLAKFCELLISDWAGRCGSHQICKSFNTISEIVKPTVEMEISLEEMVK